MDYITFMILGLGVGAVYAGLALSVLMIFKATGVVNFAQGALAIWGAYVAFELQRTGVLVLPVGAVSLGGPLSVGPAILIGLLSGVAVSGLVYLLVFYPLRKAPALAQVVASIGVMLTLQALVVLRFGSGGVNANAIFVEQRIEIGALSISSQVFVMVGLITIISLAIGFLFKFTRIGLAIRASSEDERAAILTGYSPAKLAAASWIAGGLVSTLVVILAAPTMGLNAVNYTLYIVPALGAVLVGRFVSISATASAALGIGALQSLLTYASIQAWWPSWAQSRISTTLPFLIIIVLLYFQSDRIPMRGSLLSARLAPVRVPNVRVTTVLSGFVAGLAVLMLTQGSYRFGLITSMVLAIISLSFVVLTGYLGQISLAQAALAGTAGFILSRLGALWGVIFPLDLVIACLGAMIVGLVLAIPALRLRGTQLAIVTMAAAVAMEAFVFGNPAFTPREGNPISSPSLFGWDLGVRSGANIARIEFGILVLVILTVAAVCLALILRGDTGRAFLAVRSNERAAASIGINVTLAKVIGFGLSAFIAGLGGCLIGYSRGQLSVDSFTIFVGISLLAFAYLGGITSIGGAIVAGVLGPLGIVYVLLDSAVDLGTYYAIVSGLGLVVTSVLNPHGIAGAVSLIWRSRRRADEQTGIEAEALNTKVKEPVHG